jgi:hypothetical protein
MILFKSKRKNGREKDLDCWGKHNTKEKEFMEIV